MRIEREVDGQTYWLEIKGRWTRRDRKRWAQAGSLTDERFADIMADKSLDDEARQDAIVWRINEAKLALLREWCTACYLVDEDGVAYQSIEQLTPQGMDVLCAPLYELLHNLANIAWTESISLGESRGRRS